MRPAVSVGLAPGVFWLDWVVSSVPRGTPQWLRQRVHAL